MTTKKSLPILVGAILFCVNMSADAVTTSIMAVTGGGALNDLENNAFYSIETSNGDGGRGQVSFIGYTAEVNGERVVANQLAYDASSENYYYMGHLGTTLYRYKDGVNHVLADLADPATIPGGNEMPVGTRGSGGGDFYNGSYYYTPEPDTQSIYRVTASNDGSQFVSQAKVTPANLAEISLDYTNGSQVVVNDGLGDFGDFAINARNGMLYGSSRFYGENELGVLGKFNTLWQIDLTSAEQTMTVLNYNLDKVYQLAFNQIGNLFGTQSDGAMHRLNRADGTIVATAQISDNSSGDWVDSTDQFYDVASTQTRDGVPVIVPEPSSIFLLLSSIPLVLRRRR